MHLGRMTVGLALLLRRRKPPLKRGPGCAHTRMCLRVDVEVLVVANIRVGGTDQKRHWYDNATLRHHKRGSQTLPSSAILILCVFVNGDDNDDGDGVGSTS